ncbi:MAG TPA: peptide ABC transporter substrate-binding protein [Spirochaetaceae bacterium]|nr:peptide ABC transporter substrate-binding protein [Spirochaetaceae bacterium]
MSATTLLSGRGLRKSFPVRRGVLMLVRGQLKALHSFDFDIRAGETLGVVGESGCGKTTLGRVLARIHEGEGSLEYTGRDGQRYDALGKLDPKRELAFRRDVQMVFQDPYSSLDPRMTVEKILLEPLEAHGMAKDKAAAKAYLCELLARVGLHADALQRYPHEFSGGQRQRIAVARALALKPRLIICDEPTSALDVSVQSQVINLLKEIQEREGLAYIFISHNLDLVRYVSDRIYVMYLGRVVEAGESELLFSDPAHPYTQALLRSIPNWDPQARSLLNAELRGEAPSPLWDPPGCPFEPRCPKAAARCRSEAPAQRDVRGRLVACHFA